MVWMTLDPRANEQRNILCIEVGVCISARHEFEGSLIFLCIGTTKVFIKTKKIKDILFVIFILKAL